MPIYEYACPDCGGQFQVLILKQEEEKTLLCPECRGNRPRRLISRVAYHVSEADRLADYDGRSRKSEGFYRDSRNIGLEAKKRARQLGVDLGGGFEEKLDKIRSDPGGVLKEGE